MVIDASVWVSYLLPSDANHVPSRTWLRAYLASGKRLAAPLLLVAEVGGAMSRRAGSGEVGRRAVRTLFRIPLISWVPVDVHTALVASRVSCDLQLRGADAVYVAVALSLQLPLVTWDGEQRSRAAGLVSASTPGELSAT